jgi:hypothetical protein
VAGGLRPAAEAHFVRRRGEPEVNVVVGTIETGIKVLEFCSTALQSLARAKGKRSADVFGQFVDPAYRQLEVIHKDYTTNLSILRDHLSSKTLPPRELLQWLRASGIKYRAEREDLWTIRSSLLAFDYATLVPKKAQPQLQYALRGFVAAIVKYYESTIGPSEWSFYRDYEHHLEAILSALDGKSMASVPPDKLNAHLAAAFYGTDYVADVNQGLLEICDRKLPERWKEVAGFHRMVQQLLGFPAAGTGSGAAPSN